MSTQQPSAPTKLYAFAITECLLVFPATFFIVVATLRGLQPRQYEPARTSWIIFEWMTTQLTRAHAAIMFLVLPPIAFLLGIQMLLQSWRQSELFRSDIIAVMGAVRRNLHLVFVTVATLAGIAIAMAAVVHMITD
jgi:hypothetical protein